MTQKRAEDLDYEAKATRRRSIRVARTRTMVKADMIGWSEGPRMESKTLIKKIRKVIFLKQLCSA